MSNIQDKPYRLWAGDPKNKELGIQCLFWPKCEHCGTKMQFWTAKPHKFSINDGDDIPRSHALDMELYCPNCGLWEAFGVAISAEHYQDIIEWGKRHPNRHYFKVSQFKQNIPSSRL